MLNQKFKHINIQILKDILLDTVLEFLYKGIDELYMGSLINSFMQRLNVFYLIELYENNEEDLQILYDYLDTSGFFTEYINTLLPSLQELDSLLENSFIYVYREILLLPSELQSIQDFGIFWTYKKECAYVYWRNKNEEDDWRGKNIDALYIETKLEQGYKIYLITGKSKTTNINLDLTLKEIIQWGPEECSIQLNTPPEIIDISPLSMKEIKKKYLAP